MPKLPLSLARFYREWTCLESEVRQERYQGRLVEWEGFYRKRQKFGGHFCVNVQIRAGEVFPQVDLNLPIGMWDATNSFTLDMRLRFRGIITRANNNVEVGFVDLEIPETPVAEVQVRESRAHTVLEEPTSLAPEMAHKSESAKPRKTGWWSWWR